MKKLFKSASIILLVIPALFVTSCSDDDDGLIDGTIQLASKTYALGSVSSPGISGEAKFIQNSDNTTTIELQLAGTPSGGMHPAHIHFDTAAEGGAIALTLGTVDGDTGFSTITTNTLNDDTVFSYADLLDFDGYINVHLSATELSTLVAQGDIGQNELTGMSKAYDLGSVAVPTISGTATFSERVNGETLAVLNLEGTPDGGMHPAHIHFNTAAEGGGIAYTFASVDGTTGISNSNISVLDDDTGISYDELLDFDGYINVHLSASDLGTLVAQGDIGQNELTGESTTYTLNEVDIAGISGDVTFSERANGEALAIISLVNTPDGASHPAHIHAGSVANAPGAILFTFNAVDGTSGVSKTNVSELNDETAIGYSDVLTIDGYVNVHASATDLATLAAQGNIGANN